MVPLLGKHDLIYLLGKAVALDDVVPFKGRTKSTSEPPRCLILASSVAHIIGILLGMDTAPPVISQSIIEEAWGHVYLALLALSRSSDSKRQVCEQALTAFRRSERQMGNWNRLNRLDNAGSADDGTTGCGWLRCPLHDSDYLPPEVEILRCSGCFQVRRSLSAVLLASSLLKDDHLLDAVLLVALSERVGVAISGDTVNRLTFILGTGLEEAIGTGVC